MKTTDNPQTNPSSEDAAQTIAVMIRKSCEEVRLISEGEILGVMNGQHLTLPSANRMEDIKHILDTALKNNEDLRELVARDTSRKFYSTLFMTDAYAVILLQKEGDPLELIAEITRQNSQAYPRPVPLDLFTRPPFDLAEQDIMDCINRMATDEAYRDIALSTTSTSRKFLYSTLHLEPSHASLLAEWLDVGQSNNP
jgi:hypothetical protein